MFGKEYGSCQVSLDKTKVQASVSCSVAEPRVTRPNEGILSVFVDLSPMAAPKFLVGRLTEEEVEINRTKSSASLQTRLRPRPSPRSSPALSMSSRPWFWLERQGSL